MANQSNEWEFQGEIIATLNDEIKTHDWGFDSATQEFTHGDRARSDVVVWKSRTSQSAILALELKEPGVPLRNEALRRDAVKKAQRVSAPYLALWNIRTLEVYRTPAHPRKTLTDDDLIDVLGTIETVRKVEDWITAENKRKIRTLCRNLLITCYDLSTQGRHGGNIIDATVFVESLKGQVRRLRSSAAPDVSLALTGSNRSLGTRLRNWAEEQGLKTLVEDLSSALAGQISYRLTGQILFYYAFRRKQPSLPAISLRQDLSVVAQMRDYWDRVRSFDYEALFEESILEEIKFSLETEELIRKLVSDLAAYDWDRIRVDVLGSIFEQLLPESERITLGQYYTPPALADVALSFTLQDDDRHILDPAVGSGTFLLRAYDRLRRKHGLNHSQVLDALWGNDISAFPAELAVINLCRQDLDSQINYPRVIVRDFFDLKPSDTVKLPVPRLMPGGNAFNDTPLPRFDAIVGNPPFVRSQQLDDLRESYKGKLTLIARAAGVTNDSKFDALAYFIVHAEKFLKPGGRLGFVTSAAWLTADYGGPLQRFLLSKLRVRAVLFSDVEPFFPYQSVNTVCVFAEKPTESDDDDKDEIRFISISKTLGELLPDPESQGYWGEVDVLVDSMLSRPEGTYDGYRISIRSFAEEFSKSATLATLNWARPLRESDVYRSIFGGSQ